MDNPIYNSLADKLKQSGIISENSAPEQEENVFLRGNFYDDENDLIDEIEEQKQTIEPSPKRTKKRINRYDLELINGENKNNESPISPLKILQRFLNFKELKLNQGSAGFRERIFNRFFPKLYKIKIAKDALKRLTELDIDTEALLNKTIPYGESESRYEELVKYLNYANEIQAKLNKKF